VAVLLSLPQDHTLAVVWEWTAVKVNGKWQTLNPWTDRHQIWNTWLCRGHLPSRKIRVNPPRGFCPHIRQMYTQNLQMFTSLFSFLPSPYRQPVGLHLIRPMTQFCARKCNLGVRKFSFNIKLIYSKKNR